MELSYHTTFHYRGVVFYLTETGNRAYFLCGGVVYSVCRPSGGVSPGEIAKLGLALRGTGPKDWVIANYVRSELRRRRDGSAGTGASEPPGEDEVFLDCAGLLGPHVTSESDLCNSPSVEVEDECLAEYFTSLRTNPGVVVTGVRVSPAAKTIQVLETPDIVNSASGFAYTPAPHAFVLVQARLARLPESLAPLTDGLFDGVPAPRRPINDAPQRTDIIVTGRKSAQPLTVASTPTPRAQRRAAVSEFVQVKLIERIGRAGGSAEVAPLAPARPLPPRAPTLADLGVVFLYGDDALAADGGSLGLTPEEESTRSALRNQAWALFGSSDAPRAFLGSSLALTPIQKMAVAYYLIQRERRAAPFSALVSLAGVHASDPSASATREQTDETAAARAVNGMFRDVLLLSSAADLFLMFDSLPPREARSSAVGNADAAALLRIAAARRSDGHAGSKTPASREHVRFLGMLISILYAGHDRLAAATVVARATGVSSLVLVAADVNRTCAFDRGPGGAIARARVATCLIALLSAHMERASESQHV
ncbi:tegument protein UL21 [Saimiriine alphaherpesvirus 1]|uniref:Tegument protein UL21 n=2 Tax=Saimiriine herpesvirus 1 (strain MV-5-4-PSL) TaxID=10353 RepID=E2IUE9_SHV1|nr:tegument protein UL21 [Saimiriine alphaherpesvirus 1]ADO13807.1 tegument protein UL21 [Saimiriine alphaherpesvirus 1]